MVSDNDQFTNYVTDDVLVDSDLSASELCQGTMQRASNNHVTKDFAQLYLRLWSEHHVSSSTIQIIAEAIHDIQSANVSAMALFVKQKLEEMGISAGRVPEIDNVFGADFIMALHSAPCRWRVSF